VANAGRLLDQLILGYLVHWHIHEVKRARISACGGNGAGSHLSHGLP